MWHESDIICWAVWMVERALATISLKKGPDHYGQTCWREVAGKKVMCEAHLSNPASAGAVWDGKWAKAGHIPSGAACLPPAACKLAEYAGSAARGTQVFRVPETLSKHGTETAQRAQWGSRFSSWGCRWRNYRSLPAAKLFWLHKSSGPLSSHSTIRSGVSESPWLHCGGSCQKVYMAIFMVPPWQNSVLPWKELRESSIWSPRKSEGQTTSERQLRRKVHRRCYLIHIQEKIIVPPFSSLQFTGIKLLNHASDFLEKKQDLTGQIYL